MKSFVSATIFALVGCSMAAPATLKRQSSSCVEPTQDQVLQAIQKWNNDVTNVNAFLNEAPSQNPTDLLNAAQEALINAHDEPVELGILACISGLADNAEGAITNLQEVFGNVPSSLQNIINNPGDAQNVAVQLQDINNTRCCNVLPDLDILWQAAADDEGISDQVNTVVPRPNACATVAC